MKGCRHPRRERQRSETDPINGLLTAFTATAIPSASPASTRSTTCTCWSSPAAARANVSACRTVSTAVRRFRRSSPLAATRCAVARSRSGLDIVHLVQPDPWRSFVRTGRLGGAISHLDTLQVTDQGPAGSQLEACGQQEHPAHAGERVADRLLAQTRFEAHVQFPN